MSLEVSLQVADRSADDQEIDDLAAKLRQELLDVGVDDVAPMTAGPAPAGARGVDLVVIGGLLVSVQQSADAVSRLLSTVRDWLRRNPEPARTVRLTLADRTIELTGATSEQQDRLIAEFVKAASAEPAGER